MTGRQNNDVVKALGWFGIDELPIQKILESALSRGGDLAELYFERTVSNQVVVERKKIDRILRGNDSGLGLRVISKNRSVYGYTTNLTAESVLALAKKVASGVTSQSEPKNLDGVTWQDAVQRTSEIQDYQVTRPISKLTISQKKDIALRISNGAYAVLPDADQVASMLADSQRMTLVLNSDGLISRGLKETFLAYAQTIGSSGDRTESAHVVDGGQMGEEFFEETSPEAMGKKSAERVKILLSADPAPAGTMPVVISADAGGTMIHEAVGHGLEADLSCNSLSVYEGRLGEKVASELITVVDDGTLPGKRGSFVFDDEGTASQKNVLIENGVLKSYMVDRLSAMKFDLAATGNGRRESFRHLPMVRMTNTYIAPGKDDPEEILKDTPDGVFVKAMGGGQVNTVTGDFVFAVTEGYTIKDGKLDRPIRGATLVGNGPKVIENIDRVGTDLGFLVGTCGKNGQGAPVTDAQPTIRIPELTIGGISPAAR